MSARGVFSAMPMNDDDRPHDVRSLRNWHVSFRKSNLQQVLLGHDTDGYVSRGTYKGWPRIHLSQSMSTAREMAIYLA